MATKALGLLLKRNGTTIAEVKTVTGPGLSLGTVEVTHLTSTAGYKEFIATVKEMKAITFGGNFLPADATQSYAAGLINDLDNSTLQDFTITFTDVGGTVWAFSAYVTDFDVTGVTPEGSLGFNCTLRPSGQPTLA